MLYEMRPAAYAESKMNFYEREDGGATRALFACVVSQCGLGKLVAKIESDLAAMRTAKGGAK